MTATEGEPTFLTVDEVLTLHEEQLRLFGGSAGIRDRGVLESAVAMPAATFGGEFLHSDLFEMAAAYAFHIAEGQPFVDGNKRAALDAALVFLDLNGWVVSDPEMRLYEGMIGFATGDYDKPRFAELSGAWRLRSSTMWKTRIPTLVEPVRRTNSNTAVQSIHGKEFLLRYPCRLEDAARGTFLQRLALVRGRSLDFGRHE